MKLINPNGQKHDYSKNQKSTVSHALIFQVEFKDFITNGFIGKIRTCLFVKTGDFAFFSMESGSIGIYEITKVIGFAIARELGEPFRDYSCEFVLCGYLQDNSVMGIFSGYGEY